MDGDTFYLTNGAAVRLLDIDTPELGGPQADLADAAKHALRRLVERRQVRLEYSSRLRDRYGRFLAYVFVREQGAQGSEIFVNAELVRLGLAKVWTLGMPGDRAGELMAAEREAQKAKRGLWASTR